MENFVSPLISVIITTFNRPSFIKKAVSNVLGQTYSEIEIIIIDDNGINTEKQKNTFKEIKTFVDSKNVKYFALPNNSGACFARNFGANIASANYIAFFDDDDLWSNNKIQKQIAKFIKTDRLGFVYCFQNAINPQTEKILFSTKSSIGKGNVFENLLHIEKGSLATPNPLISKSAFEDVGGFDENLQSAQDIDLFLRISQKYKVDVVPEVLHTAIIHTRERISVNHNNKISGYKLILKKYSQYMHIDTLKFIHSRIIYHCFWIKSKHEAQQSITFLKKNVLLTKKYLFFAFGLENLFIRSLIKLYFSINNYKKI